jgi:hypothetical protein
VIPKGKENTVIMVIDSGKESLAAYHVPAQEAETPKTRQLPVTLLSGFLVLFSCPMPLKGLD